MSVRLADLRPTSLRANQRAAYYLAMLGNPRAESMAARAHKLTTADDWEGNRGYFVFWIEARTARQAWLANDLQELVSELGRLDSIKDRILATQLRYMAEADLAFMDGALGRSEASRSRLEALGDDFDFRDEHLVRVAYVEGDSGSLERYLDIAVLKVESHRYPNTIIPLLLVRAGRVAEAEGLLGRLLLAPETETTLRGALALARGNYEEVVAILDGSHKKMTIIDGGYFLATEVLSEAFLKLEMPQRARATLERALNQRARSAAMMSMAAWNKNQQLLARLLREMGEETQAAEIEAELSRLLALGDEDHPIKIWLAELNAGED